MSAKKFFNLGIVLLLAQAGSTVAQLMRGLSFAANMRGTSDDLFFLAGHFLIGIVGLIFVAIGLVKHYSRRK